MKFTAKQQRFIDAYDGDMRKAAAIAGISYNYGRQLMTMEKHKHVAEAIKNRESGKSDERIATRKERQAFWTKVMKDVEESMKDRLKASELLGKSEADFTETIVLRDKTVKVVKKRFDGGGNV